MNPNEILDDIAGLCSKIALNNEIKNVHSNDLTELRDMINGLKKHIAKHGYKTIPGLVNDNKEPK